MFFPNGGQSCGAEGREGQSWGWRVSLSLRSEQGPDHGQAGAHARQLRPRRFSPWSRWARLQPVV